MESIFKSLSKFSTSIVSKLAAQKSIWQQFHDGKQIPGYKFPEKDGEDFMKRYKLKGPVLDISKLGFNDRVYGFKSILNDKTKFKREENFYLIIQPGDGLVRLTAFPTKDQPGNGMLAWLSGSPESFRFEGKTYKDLHEALIAYYETDTKSFAEDFLKLCNDIACDGIPQVTTEVSLLFAYEVARRLANSDSPSKRKEELDALPIGIAIPRIIKLLLLGNPEICSFDDVFLPGGKFHCFTDTPSERAQRIININEEVTSKINGGRASTTEDYIQELTLFSAGKLFVEMSPADQLKEKFKALEVTPKNVPPGMEKYEGQIRGVNENDTDGDKY